jgi:hypothetical protein
MNTSYGGFYGGDPRKFHPDEECCSPAEIEAHRRACAEWDKGNCPPDPPLHEMHHDPVTGELIMHIARNPFGIGITVHDDEPEDDFCEPDIEMEDMDDDELMGIYLSNAGPDSDRAARILADRNGVDLADEPESEMG